MLVVDTIAGHKQVDLTIKDLLNIIEYQATRNVNPPSQAYKIIVEAVLELRKKLEIGE